MENLPIPLHEIAVSALKEVKGLANKLLGPAFEELGATVGDRIRIFRLKEQIKLLQRTNQILEEQNISPKIVNLKVLLPLLEAGSLEEDEEMTERWASLLASAADPNNEISQEASYVEILKQLSPADAFLLQIFYEQITFQAKIPQSEWPESGVNTRDLQQLLNISDYQFKITIDNLMRLRLIDHPSVKFDVVNGNEVRFQVTSAGILCATQLGNAFVTACNKGGKPRITIKDGQRCIVAYCIPCNSISNIYWTKGGKLPIPANTQSSFGPAHF